MKLDASQSAIKAFARLLILCLFALIFTFPGIKLQLRGQLERADEDSFETQGKARYSYLKGTGVVCRRASPSFLTVLAIGNTKLFAGHVMPKVRSENRSHGNCYCEMGIPLGTLEGTICSWLLV